MNCPVCGYDAVSGSEPAFRMTDLELKEKQRLDYFKVHAMQSWWIQQPEEICKWLKMLGISPQSILDAGCGDGRWLPGILKIWPDVKYTGIDRLEDHIRLNQEGLPEYEWILGDISYCHFLHKKIYDFIIIGGTLNPRMPLDDQSRFLNAVMGFNPKQIVCLFDLEQTGEPPDKWLLPAYSKVDTWVAPRDLKSPRQNIETWLYVRR